MAYFPDMSPYTYAGSIPSAVNIGWLDSGHDFPKGSVPSGVVKKLKILAAAPELRHRGFHQCEFCGLFSSIRWSQQERRSNTVFTVRSEDKIYAAPGLIVHYIEAHGYLPPAEFLHSVDVETNTEEPDLTDSDKTP